MKNTKIVIAILFLGLFQSGFAQQPKDSKGHIILNSKGDIYVEGVKAGFITKDSLIKNAKGKQIGFINADGSVSDAKGKKIGRAGKDGKTYYDSFGAVAFAIQDSNNETCNILDAQGKVIGNIHNSYKGSACALHCFENKMDMKKHQKIKK